jgi:hypothetical protein
MFSNASQRDSADNVLSIVKNVSGATLAAGAIANFEDGTNADGVRVTVPATATLGLCAGVIPAAIANNEYGFCLRSGYTASASVTNNTSVSVLGGDILVPVNAASYLARSAAADGKTGFFQAMELVATATTPAAALKKVLVKCL